MERRQFLRYGGAGLVAGAVMAGSNSGAWAACTSLVPSCTISLVIESVNTEMVDGQVLPMLGFRRVKAAVDDPFDFTARVPGPVLRVIEGQIVTVKVRNNRPESHSVHFPGVPMVAGGIASIDNIPGNGGTASVTFQAPVAGTYVYHDPSHPSRHLYRLLGLHGVMVVHPLNGLALNSGSGSGAVTPYSMDKLLAVDEAAARTVSQVFNAFGKPGRFPGSKWVPSPVNAEYSAQERIWLFSQVDPDYNTLIKPTGIFRAANDRIYKRALPVPTTPEEVVAAWTPRYFTINGKSGFDLRDEPSVVCQNYIGEPTLLRTLNVGLCHHAAHIHGNHVLQLAHSYVTDDGLKPSEGTHRVGIPGEPTVHDNVWERDTWPTWPMQTRDVLLPYEVPPDIPNWSIFENVPSTAQEPFPIRYVMHDHCEMATTAAGGNYPQGAVTHWEILGPMREPPV
ncbi:MAG: multicopper oxidase domain-containing protein [Hyphomicrobiaceae bacterium]